MVGSGRECETVETIAPVGRLRLSNVGRSNSNLEGDAKFSGSGAIVPVIFIASDCLYCLTCHIEQSSNSLQKIFLAPAIGYLGDCEL